MPDDNVVWTRWSEKSSPQPSPQSEEDSRGGGGNDGGMTRWQVGVEVRLTELREAISGMRHSQNLTLGAVVGFGTLLGAFVIGFSIYGFQKIDALPSEFNSIAQGITQAITATSAVKERSQAPIIIQIPENNDKKAPISKDKP
jgi:hypothetical protein